MNPYEVLGVDPGATDQQIKSAYRKLMKEFHPDKNKSENAKGRVVLINAAYEVLSDPRKRALYNEPSYVEVEESEDPVEAYKREFKRKRWEEEKKRKARNTKREMVTYRIMRILSFPILSFAFILIVDDYLPRKIYDEVAERGWQERSRGGRARKGELISFVETQHFSLPVPHSLELNYPFYDEKKPKFRVFATPIFKVPRSFSYTLDGVYDDIEIYGTIHAIPIPLPWLLMISSLIVAFNRGYRNILYSVCFFQLMLVAYILVFFFV